MESSNVITALCILGHKYGTDKTPLIKHSYTPFYYELFNEKKKKIKKVLELGIGHFEGMQDIESIYDPGLKRNLHRAASLYMWRDFFINAQIYGADIRRESIIQDERIKTFLCDETKESDLKKLIQNTGGDIDIFIDDASHHVKDQIFAAKVILPLLKEDAIYIIEDVSHCNKICRALDMYNPSVPFIPKAWRGGRLVVVQK